MSKGKILFIAPSFYNYHNLIKEEMEDQGYEVVYIKDEPTSKYYKYIKKTPFKQYIINKYWKNILSQDFGQIDKIFVIRGETLNSELVEPIFQKYKKSNKIYYLWDSIENTPSYESIYKYFDKVFSFDYLDTQNYNHLIYKTLFYPETSKINIDNQIEFDVSFIGSAHGDRLSVLAKTLKVLKKLEIKTFFYIYMSVIQKLKYTLKGDKDYLYLKNFIYTTPLPYEKVQECFDKSKAILDINNINQSGLTMRTFETLVCKKQIITTNRYIKEHDFYSDKSILIIDREKINIDKNFFQNEINYINIEQYIISSWVKDILFEE